jgi:hypothetical protein
MTALAGLLAAVDQYAAAAHTVLKRKSKSDQGRRWLAYSSAVGSALALAGSADAGIIYSGPQNISVSVGKGSGFRSSLKRIAINRAFSETLIVSHSRTSHFASSRAQLFHQLFGHTAGVNLSSKASGAVRRLASGQMISANAPDKFGYRVLLRQATQTYFGAVKQRGPWGATTTGFAGFRYLDVGNQYHYGWIRLKLSGVSPVTSPGQATLTAVDWAYEDTPNTPIAAGDTGPSLIPEPSTLALAALAAGAAGVYALRRRKARLAVQTSTQAPQAR